MVLKRQRPRNEDNTASNTPAKRQRTGLSRQLLDFSDEILLRVFGFLPVPYLLCVERVSQRFHHLASDSGIWRSKYYEQWIYSRARRIPLLTKPSISETPPATKLAQWLQHGATLRGGVVDWKRLYKIRNNWVKGAAKFEEVDLAAPPAPPVLARVHKGLIFTVDASSGLRAWSQKEGRKQTLWQTACKDKASPYSLSVDTRDGETFVIIGYGNGSFSLHRLDPTTGFETLLNFKPTNQSAVVSIALATPYILTMTCDKHIYLYQLIHSPEESEDTWSVATLATLHAHAPLQPAALSLRCTNTRIIGTISYAFNQLGGWCLGMQEMRLSMKGDIVGSRLTSTIDTPLEARYRGRTQWDVSSSSASSTPFKDSFAFYSFITTQPTSLSYCHPFLLASLPDNTIMSYVVTSDDEKLEISTGKRLWGHTSAVSRAVVGNRGKAVSVSAEGEEIRVWELEEALTTPGRGRIGTEIKLRSNALDVVALAQERGCGLELALREMRRGCLSRRWVGFDDEQVVVMGERDSRQIMACYDFT